MSLHNWGDAGSNNHQLFQTLVVCKISTILALFMVRNCIFVENCRKVAFIFLCNISHDFEFRKKFQHLLWD